ERDRRIRAHRDRSRNPLAKKRTTISVDAHISGGLTVGQRLLIHVKRTALGRLICFRSSLAVLSLQTLGELFLLLLFALLFLLPLLKSLRSSTRHQVSFPVGTTFRALHSFP